MWVPALSEDVEQVTAGRVCVQKAVVLPLSVKVIVPVGAGAPEGTLTVAVKVTLPFRLDGLTEVTDVVVLAWVIVCVTDPLVLVL